MLKDVHLERSARKLVPIARAPLPRYELSAPLPLQTGRSHLALEAVEVGLSITLSSKPQPGWWTGGGGPREGGMAVILASSESAALGECVFAVFGIRLAKLNRKNLHPLTARHQPTPVK